MIKNMVRARVRVRVWVRVRVRAWVRVRVRVRQQAARMDGWCDQKQG